jgi:hypothetical protein
MHPTVFTIVPTGFVDGGIPGYDSTSVPASSNLLWAYRLSDPSNGDNLNVSGGNIPGVRVEHGLFPQLLLGIAFLGLRDEDRT